MTAHEIIAPGLIESYCLGSVSPEDKAMIDARAAGHPKLLAEIERYACVLKASCCVMK